MLKNLAPGKVTTAVAVVGAVLMAAAGLASADAIDTAIASASTSLTGYATAGVTMFIAVLMIGVGVKTLSKWVKRAASAG